VQFAEGYFLTAKAMGLVLGRLPARCRARARAALAPAISILRDALHGA
jgi:hypothetical protein